MITIPKYSHDYESLENYAQYPDIFAKRNWFEQKIECIKEINLYNLSFETGMYKAKSVIIYNPTIHSMQKVENARFPKEKARSFTLLYPSIPVCVHLVTSNKKQYTATFEVSSIIKLKEYINANALEHYQDVLNKVGYDLLSIYLKTNEKAVYNVTEQYLFGHLKAQVLLKNQFI
jgi:hypothetical protein